jgi:hypothetical protein
MACGDFRDLNSLIVEIASKVGKYFVRKDGITGANEIWRLSSLSESDDKILFTRLDNTDIPMNWSGSLFDKGVSDFRELFEVGESISKNEVTTTTYREVKETLDNSDGKVTAPEWKIPEGERSSYMETKIRDLPNP